MDSALHAFSDETTAPMYSISFAKNYLLSIQEFTNDVFQNDGKGGTLLYVF